MVVKAGQVRRKDIFVKGWHGMMMAEYKSTLALILATVHIIMLFYSSDKFDWVNPRKG